MARSESRRRDPWTRIWLGCGALWSLGLVLGGSLIKSYSSSDGPGRSLVEENGLKVLLVLAMPLVDVAIVALALQRRRRARVPGVGVLVWLVFGVLALLVVLGALSIGPFIGPVAVFVILAIVSAKSQPTVSE